jgi:membrane fusion protein (multidrug efflux system)
MNSSAHPDRRPRASITLALLAALAACSAPSSAREPAATAPAPAEDVAVRDSVIASTIDFDGVAEPVQQATVATKLMGTVAEVFVREGQAVASGQPLVRIDARDVDAKAAQSAAAVASATAARDNALVQAVRFRRLYADSAAPKAMLDAAETGLAQAEAGLRAANAGGAEVESVRDYAIIRAPFAGVVTRRFVDPGAFATPGMPLATIQDASRLRVGATATPDAARALARGAALDATVNGQAAQATVEGVVPSAAGGVYTINAIVANARLSLPAGTPATLAVRVGTRHALLVPSAALVRQGDLVGVRVRAGSAVDLRWVKAGRTIGTMVEILSGVRAGELVVVPTGRGA